ncbi:hypothetical protein F4781DRAFT_369682 [Annulohypoxylon bovei var. microspora]|nr:hypothetical protein F4781DRAFT_369682 [Annulohypoxylon bovei var. microspora]
MTTLAPEGRPFFIWIIVFSVVTTLTILMRYWAAWLIKRPFSADDALVTVGYISTMVNAAFFIHALFRGGLGKPSVELEPNQQVILARMTFISSIAWIVGNLFAKLSILYLYNRIFTVEKFRQISCAVICLTVVYGIVFFAIFVSHCQPVSNLWNPQPGGWCRVIATEEFSSTCSSLVIDLIIIVLPMPILWGLHMTLYKRVILSIMFSIGLITIAVMSWRLVQTTQTVEHPERDFLTQMPTLGLIVMLELWLGVIVACIPTLAPVLNIYMKPLVSKMYSGLSNRTSIQQNFTPIETIGAKRTRQKYIELEAIPTRLDGTSTAECAFDAFPQQDLQPTEIYVRRDVNLTRVQRSYPDSTRGTSSSE